MLRTLAFVLFLTFGLVSANFDFFSNLFGHQQEEHHQTRFGASQWRSQADSAMCNGYLCPTTLDCVSRPVDCPCPDEQDIKCVIPDPDGQDASYVCVRGQNDCAQVEGLLKRGSARK